MSKQPILTQATQEEVMGIIESTQPVRNKRLKNVSLKKCSSSVTFDNCVIEKLTFEAQPNIDLRIRNCHINELIVENCKVYLSHDQQFIAKRMSFKLCSIVEIEPNFPSEIRYLSINAKQSVRVYNLFSYKLEINGCSFIKGPFRDINTSILSLIDVKGFESEFRNVNASNLFYSQGTDFKETTFLDCDFARSKIVFKRSTTFFQINSLSTKWPATYKKYVDDDLTIRESHQNLIQMKKVAEKSHDYVFQRQVAAIELEAYLNHLFAWTTNPIQTLILTTKHFGLVFSKITNNFGRNWGLPILWFAVSLVGYFMLMSYLDNGKVDNWDTLFQIALPTHKVELLVDDCSYHPTAIYAIDLLWKVWSGMLIFQLIKAFRFYTIK